MLRWRARRARTHPLVPVLATISALLRAKFHIAASHQSSENAGYTAANGFAALADLDSNHDGKIDSNDDAYS